MGDENGHGGGDEVVDVFPLNHYYFGSKAAVPDKDPSLADRIHRLKSIYEANGLRTCVEGVLLVELRGHPHVLLLQVKNSFFRLPGGRLRPGESDTEGLKRKLSSKLSLPENCISDNWQIGECIGMWWRSNFETLPYPYLPPNGRRPKECTKLFLVRLPMSRRFIVPRSMKLLAVPLFQIHDNCKTYGPIISGISYLLSKFSLNIIQGLLLFLALHVGKTFCISNYNNRIVKNDVDAYAATQGLGDNLGTRNDLGSVAYPHMG